MLPTLPAGCCAGAPKATPAKAAAPSGANLTLGACPFLRHARESGHPGATDTAPEALGPRLRGGDEEEKIGVICLVRTTGTKMAGPRQFEASGAPCYTLLEEASVVT